MFAVAIAMLSAAVPPAPAAIEFRGPAAAVIVAERDIKTVPEHSRIYMRYAWHPGPRAALEDFVPVQSFQVNSLSRLVPFAQPIRVGYDVWRFDLRLWDLDPVIWEKLKDIDPYFHVLLKKDAPAKIETATEFVEPEPEYVWRKNPKAPTQYGLFRLGKQVGAYDKRFGYRPWSTKTKKWGKVTDAPITLPDDKAARPVTKKIEPPKTAPAKTNVIAHGPWLPAKEIAYLAQVTGSQVPIVRADWLFVQWCRQISLTNAQTGVGYYDWLKIKTREDFFNLARFKIKDSQDLRLDQLAAVTKSGVSHQNRQIDREPTLTGSLWFTRDVLSEQGRGNAVRNLKRTDFEADAQELYMPLPNGLPAYFLCDDKTGNIRQDSAPDFIGPDDSPLNASKDSRIHVCLACVRCHGGEVLKPVPDWARANFNVGRLALLVPSDFKKLGKDKQFELFEELKRQYLSDLNLSLDLDRKAYQRAIIGACGLDAATLAKRYAKAFHGYADTALTLEQAALELGATASELRAALLRFATGKGAIDPELGGLLLFPQQTIPRLHFEESYSLLHKILAGDLRD